MLPRTIGRLLLLWFLLAGAEGVLCRAQVSAQPPTLTLHDLGKDAVPLDGPWQFHLGDDPAWASPALDDATGHNGWEQLTADQPWGVQGHRSYVGYAWYRKHLSISPASGVGPDWSLLIPYIDDIYAIYWNGNLVATHGKFPPDPSWRYRELSQSFALGSPRDGVLAIRVYDYPLGSTDDGHSGGLYAPPLLGSAQAISLSGAIEEYRFLRQGLFDFAIDALEILLVVVTLLFWRRDRSQRVLLWTALFCFAEVAFNGFLNIPIHPLPSRFSSFIARPVVGLQVVSFWFLLVYLLGLESHPRLLRWTRILAIVYLAQISAAGADFLLDWSRPGVALPAQLAEWGLNLIPAVLGNWGYVLVAFALRTRLDWPRRLVAVFAVIANAATTLPLTLLQLSRFTDQPIAPWFYGPLFTVAGFAIFPEALANTGLLLSIVYAVYRYTRRALARKQAIEQELESARKLQQALIPENLPSVPGYTFSSAYRPALEVGGDFFQIFPLDGESAGSTIVLLGDVSGKGLRAAMTVTLIVGAARMLVDVTTSPAEILHRLNRRLCGQMQGGFVTCVVLRLQADGACVFSSAGHPAPLISGHEPPVTGALPLGLFANVQYEECSMSLNPGDHLALYTDGLLEARSLSGELYSFDRLKSLFAGNPSATSAAETGIAFGQEDDVTVLTFTRLNPTEGTTAEQPALSLATIPA